MVGFTMTLFQWSEVNNVFVVSRGAARLVPQTVGNWELWKLKDYLVSTVSGGTIWLMPRPATTFVIALVHEDELIDTQFSTHSLHKTLRCAWELLGGIPQAEVCIRRNGNMVAWLHTNFRGELEEVEVHAPNGRVTPMNPLGPTFQGVFAE